MPSNFTSYHVVYDAVREPAPPPKPLEQMSDAEVAAAVVERLKFPFLCKACGQRVKDVNTSGVCGDCAGGWWSWRQHHPDVAYIDHNLEHWHLHIHVHRKAVSRCTATLSVGQHLKCVARADAPAPF